MRLTGETHHAENEGGLMLSPGDGGVVRVGAVGCHAGCAGLLCCEGLGAGCVAGRADRHP
jgi:hypothetical protein